MPLSDSQKQQIVSLSGLDPSAYTTDEEGYNIIPLSATKNVQPSFSPETVVQKALPPTPLETFGRSAIHAAPSAAGGLFGAKLGMFAGAPLGPLGIAGGGIIGGLAGGGLTRLLQSEIEDELVPEQQRQEFESGQQANPLAAKLGSLATLPIGGFNPSIRNVSSAVGAVPKMLTGMPLTAAERLNLGNVGIGAGIGAGVNAGEQAVSNQPFDLSQLLEAAGTGGLFNKPNIIGRNIGGFHTPEPNDIVSQLQNTPDAIGNRLPVVPSTAMPIEQLMAAGGTPITRGLKEVQQGEGTVMKPAGDAMARFKQTPAEPDVQTFENEGGKSLPDQNDVDSENFRKDLEFLQQRKDEIQKQQKERAQKIADYDAAKHELAMQELDGQIAQIQDQIEANKVSNESDIIKGVNPQRDFTKEQTKANQEVAADTADLENRRLEGFTGDKYSDESKLPPFQEHTPEEIEQQRLAAKADKVKEANFSAAITSREARRTAPSITATESEFLNNENNPKVATRQWYDTIKKWAGDVKGIKIDSSGEVVNDKGQSVAGVTLLEKGIPQAIKVNPFKRGADTEPHELFHAFFNTLRNSDRPADRRIVGKYEQAIQREPDYQQWFRNRIKDGQDASPEEYAATNAGYEFIKRVVNSDAETPFKTYLNDFASYLKTRFGKHADLQDYQRLLNYRLVYGKEKIGNTSSKLPSSVATPDWQDTKEQGESKLGIKENPNKDSAFEPFITPKSSPSKEAIYALENDRGEREFHALTGELKDRLRNTSVKQPVYHKTTYEFERANPEEAQNKGFSSVMGMHVGTVKAANERGMGPDNANIHKYWLDMRNPYEVDDSEANLNNMLYKKMLHDGLMSEKEFVDYEKISAHNKEGKLQQANFLKDILQRAGYDGLKYENGVEDQGKPSYVVFDKSQLVNAISQKRAPTGELYSPLSKLTEIFKPQLQKIKEKYGQEGEDLSNAVQRYYPKKDEVYGKGMNPILQSAKGLDKTDLAKVEDVLIRENRDKQYYNNTLNPEQKVLYDAIRTSLKEKQQDQIAANQPITQANGIKRLPQIDPYYFPNKINPEVADILNDPTRRVEANKLKQDFITYQTQRGLNAEQAQAKLDSIAESYHHGTINLTKFNANREAQGIGLPESWMRRGKLLQNLAGYYNRVSADRAYHDTIETNPDVATSLGIKNDPWGRPHASTSQDISGAQEVRDLVDKLHGESFDVGDRKLKSLNRIATSLMLGPLTNIHIAASSVANGIQYTHPSYTVQAITHGLTHLTEGLQHALQTGYAKKNLTSFNDIWDANNTSLEKMAATANTIGNLSGRDATNNLTKGYMQAFSEYVLKQKVVEAANGNLEAQRLLKHIDPDYTVGTTYTGSDLNAKASVFASLVHGAHDTRTMPSWMLKETAIQPFLQLASWNIAQTNQWMEHVWKPATSGNLTPLIMSTLGATLGGYIIKKAREEISDKKSPIPSLSELVNSERGIEGNIPLVAYNFMAMTSYVGYGGMLSVLGKAVEDIAHKNIPQGATFPLDELISNPTLRISQAASALMNDNQPDYFNVGTKLVTDLFRENFQLGRIATTWMANANALSQLKQQKDITDKMSDLRRFKMAEGLPYDSQTGVVGNPYVDLDTKKFKRSTDVGEAVGELPDLISNALDKAKGNVEVLRSELQKIKQNSYQTMPSPDKTPREFLRYVNWLNQTNPDEASNRLVDYFKQNAVNKAKSDMVPSL